MPLHPESDSCSRYGGEKENQRQNDGPRRHKTQFKRIPETDQNFCEMSHYGAQNTSGADLVGDLVRTLGESGRRSFAPEMSCSGASTGDEGETRLACHRSPDDPRRPASAGGNGAPC